jgi:LysM repeat protein
MEAYVQFTTVNPPGQSLNLEMGDGPAKLTSAGGWQTTARPRRTALTEWQGQDPVTMDIPVMLDRFFTEGSVEPEISIIFGWLRVASGPAQTPVIRIDGPVPLTGALWVLNGIEWGAEERRASDGQRIRQALTLTMMEYVSPDILIQGHYSPAAAATSRAVASATAAATATTTSTAVPGASSVAPGGTPATGSTAPATPPSTWNYTVVKGDTLPSIAKANLADANKWHQIADLNGIRDPKKIKIGQILKMPPFVFPPAKPTPLTGVVTAGHGRLT